MTYDLIVIGSGPAGHTACFEASSREKKVLLIEKGEIGGTCLNVGCVPTKSLISQSEKYKEIDELDKFGIKVEGKTLDYNKILENKDEVVSKLKKGIEFLVKKQKIDYVQGIASIIKENEVSVNNKVYTSHHIIVATGSKSLIPNIKGIENAIFSTEFLTKDLTNIEKVAIIGGGVIGVEIATIVGNLKKEVTIIEAMDQLLINCDKDISSTIKRQLDAKVLLKQKVIEIEKNKVITEKKEVDADLIICAIGRVPNTKDVDPNNLLVKERNYILVDNNFKTNLDSVYAIGDCIKGYQLAHYASSCAKELISRLYDKVTRINLNNIPMCVYANNEIANVGSLDTEDRIVGKYNFGSNARNIISNDGRNLVKLVFSKEGKFVGGSILAKRASDMIQVLVTALNQELSIDDMIKDVYGHPTYIEGISEALIEAKSKL